MVVVGTVAKTVAFEPIGRWLRFHFLQSHGSRGAPGASSRPLTQMRDPGVCDGPVEARSKVATRLPGGLHASGSLSEGSEPLTRRQAPGGNPGQGPPPRGGPRFGGHKSGDRPAYAQQLVTTRLLDYLHDRGRRLSRLQRIYPWLAVKLQSAGWAPLRFRGAPAAGLLGSGAGAYRYPPTARRGGSPFSGMDSDLEAFSRNPADGSFAALPCRTAAKTNYLNPRFLSY